MCVLNILSILQKKKGFPIGVLGGQAIIMEQMS